MRSSLLGVGGAVLAAAALLSACGSGTPTATGTATTIRIGATNFVTLPPTPSTNPPITSGGAAAGTIIAEESTYVVREGDYPSTVARKFKVKYEDFMALNQFVLDQNGYLPGWKVGLEVKIPAGATVPGSATAPPTATTVAGAETPTASTAAAGAPPPTEAPATTAEICVSDQPYTIKPGDAPQNVAARFDTTVDRLNAVNGGTKGYAAFIVGTVIKIPVDC